MTRGQALTFVVITILALIGGSAIADEPDEYYTHVA